MFKKIILLTASLLLAGFSVLAQDVQVKGLVSDAASGEPLVGVVIQVQGMTGRYAVTGADGAYAINAPANGTLTFSLLGYKDLEQAVGGRGIIDVSLEAASQAIEELVVVGYGVMRKIDVTGTVSSVTGEKVSQVPVTSAAEALTGKLAGVQVITTSGAPGATVKIRVRGGGSITQDNSPLYIIDGFPVEDGLQLVSPSDIDRIDVLKDASSTAIYGARGANGVVLITTKSGSARNRASVNFDAYAGTRYIPNRIDVLDAVDFTKWAYERARLASPTAESNAVQGIVDRYGAYDSYDSRYTGNSNDWQDKLYRNAIVRNYNLSVNGGGPVIRYNMSANRALTPGVLLDSNYNRTLLSGKVEYTPNEHLTVGFQTRYNHSETSGGSISISNAVKYRPTEGLNNAGWDENIDYEYYLANSLINPILLSKDTYSLRLNDNYNLMGDIQYKVGDFIFKVQAGLDSNESKNRSFNGPNSANYLKNGYNSGGYGTSSLRSWINTNTINWGHQFGDHSVKVLLGQEWVDRHSESFSWSGQQWSSYITPEQALASLSMSGGTVQKPTTKEDSYQIFSFFGRVNYDYAGKYIASMSLRADGSSMFAPENRWGFFPSAGVSWIVSEEDFMKDVSWVNSLKLRYSYGVAGNDRITSMMWTTQWITDGTTQYGIGNIQAAALKPNTLGNRNLKWETTLSSNLGLDFGLWGDRLSGSMEYYRNVVKDLLLSQTLPANAGFTSIYKNIGSTQNSGFELTLDGILVSTRDISWTANFNIAFNKNKVRALQDGVNIMYGSPGITTSGPTNEYIVEVGQPLGRLWGYVYDGWYTADDFVEGSYNPSTNTWQFKDGVPHMSSTVARPGTIKFKNVHEDDVIDTQDITDIGSTNPLHFGGFGTTFQWKNFDLAANFNWSFGNKIYNATLLELYDGRSVETNLSGKFRGGYSILGTNGEVLTSLSDIAARNKNAGFYSPYTGGWIMHSGLVEDGSFLRLNTLTAGYTLPEKLVSKIGMTSARIYATGYNLFCLTRYQGLDPEVDSRSGDPLTPGIDSFGYPKNRSFILGINLSF